MAHKADCSPTVSPFSPVNVPSARDGSGNHHLRPACKTDPVRECVRVTTLDDNFRLAVLDHISRSQLNGQQLGQLALGDPGFVPSLDNGRPVSLDTADRVLRFIGEIPIGPIFRREVEAFLFVTGGGVTLGFVAAGDTSVVRCSSPLICPSTIGPRHSARNASPARCSTA